LELLELFVLPEFFELLEPVEFFDVEFPSFFALFLDCVFVFCAFSCFVWLEPEFDVVFFAIIMPPETCFLLQSYYSKEF